MNKYDMNKYDQIAIWTCEFQNLGLFNRHQVAQAPMAAFAPPPATALESLGSTWVERWFGNVKNMGRYHGDKI